MVATPLAFKVALPSVTVPSMKVTVPVGVPLVVEVTVADKLTDCPTPTGLLEDATTVLVPAACTACVVVTVLGKNVLSPE